VPAPRKKNKHHPVLKKVGARLRELRNEQNLSQEALAHAADLERAFVSGVERGEFNVSVNALGRLADALKVHIRELFDFQ
jgi:transcriptional regulator with XRE-family HTH domain